MSNPYQNIYHNNHIQCLQQRGLDLKHRIRSGDQLRLTALRENPAYEVSFHENEPLISVIIPTYQRAEIVIERTIPSVIKQEYENWELIIVGDSMSGQNAVLLERYCAQKHQNIRFINLKRRGNYPILRAPLWMVGGTKPINYGLRLAQGQWIAHLDDDDEFLPQHLSSLLLAARNHHAEWAHGNVEFTDHKGNPIATIGDKNPRFGEISRISSIYHGLLREFRYNPNCWQYAYPGDWDLWERFLQAGVTHTYLNKTTAIHHGDAIPKESTLSFPVEVALPKDEDAEKTGSQLYDQWIDLHRKLRLPPTVYDTAIKDLPDNPHIRLACFAIGSQYELICDSCFSLLAQNYPFWSLEIISFDPPPANLPTNNRITWNAISDDSDSIEEINKTLCNLGSDWVGTIFPGDRIIPEGLFLIANEITRNRKLQWIYSDEDLLTISGERKNPIFKPDFNIDLLRTQHYTGGLSLLRRALFAKLNGFDCDFEGVEHYDLALRTASALPEESIGHVAEVLYHRHEAGHLTYLTPNEEENLGRDALNRHIYSLGLTAEIKYIGKRCYRVCYSLHSQPTVNIIIPTRDAVHDLRRCINSLLSITAYDNYRITIINNQSTSEDTLSYFKSLTNETRISIQDYNSAFNYSKMHNICITMQNEEYALLLNNDTEVLDPEWLSILIGYTESAKASVAAPLLVDTEGNVQHAGFIMGLDNQPMQSIYSGMKPDSEVLLNRLACTQTISSVSGACLLIRKKDFLEVGGFDAENFPNHYQCVDLCLKIKSILGGRTIWTPDTKLLHFGAKTLTKVQSEASIDVRQSNIQNYKKEQTNMLTRWPSVIANDPAYNPNLSLTGRSGTIELDPALTGHRTFRPLPLALACPADHHGCGEYRIKAPMRSLMRRGILDGAITARLYGPSEIMRINPDTVVFQRQLEDHQIEAMQRYRDRAGAFIIYELDDLITESWRGDFKSETSQRISNRLQSALAIADRLIASTPLIAETYGPWCSETLIVPNFIPLDRWGMLRPNRRNGPKARVGWAGGATHGPDLAMIADVVKIMQHEVEWVFLGTVPEAMRPYIHEYHDAVPIEGYPSALAYLDLDLALAPLVDNRFNRSRSSLRILEFGILGYPVIASDMPSYRGFPVTNIGPSVDDWVSAIREHIADRDALARRGDELRQHIMDNWILDRNLDVWKNAWLPKNR